MKRSTRFGPVLHHPRLFCALAILSLSACATTRTAEGNDSSESEREDIGYGTVEEGQMAGSVTRVRSEDVEPGRSVSLAEMLARVPGVRVTDLGGGALRVRIRDTSSYLGGEDPLFVVDGMVLNGGINTINPFTIESITVLKNAGETAIYGSRGANGVILIKTKKGGGTGWVP